MGKSNTILFCKQAFDQLPKFDCLQQLRRNYVSDGVYIMDYVIQRIQKFSIQRKPMGSLRVGILSIDTHGTLYAGKEYAEPGDKNEKSFK